MSYILHLLSFDSMVITSCIWCSHLQRSLHRPPLVVFLFLLYRKKARAQYTKDNGPSYQASRLPDQITRLPDLSSMTAFETMQEEDEYKFLTPVFFITDPWLWALICIIPQIYHGSRTQLLKCTFTVFSPPLTEIKATFLFPPNPVSIFF